MEYQCQPLTPAVKQSIDAWLTQGKIDDNVTITRPNNIQTNSGTQYFIASSSDGSYFIKQYSSKGPAAREAHHHDYYKNLHFVPPLFDRVGNDQTALVFPFIDKENLYQHATKHAEDNQYLNDDLLFHFVEQILAMASAAKQRSDIIPPKTPWPDRSPISGGLINPENEKLFLTKYNEHLAQLKNKMGQHYTWYTDRNPRNILYTPGTPMQQIDLIDIEPDSSVLFDLAKFLRNGTECYSKAADPLDYSKTFYQLSAFNPQHEAKMMEDVSRMIGIYNDQSVEEFLALFYYATVHVHLTYYTKNAVQALTGSQIGPDIKASYHAGGLAYSLDQLRQTGEDVDGLSDTLKIITNPVRCINQID